MQDCVHKSAPHVTMYRVRTKTYDIPKHILVPLLNVTRCFVRLTPLASASIQRSGRNSSGAGKIVASLLRIKGRAPIVVYQSVSMCTEDEVEMRTPRGIKCSLYTTG
jgi:hypothetical protein